MNIKNIKVGSIIRSIDTDIKHWLVVGNNYLGDNNRFSLKRYLNENKTSDKVFYTSKDSVLDWIEEEGFYIDNSNIDMQKICKNR